MGCRRVLAGLLEHKKIKVIFTVILVLSTFVGKSIAQGPEVYGELEYLELRMPESYDPITSESGIAMRLTSMLFDPLIGVGKNNEAVPVLAKSFTNSIDGKSVILEMRSNAKWHDGTPVTADDVKFTVDLIKNPATNANHFILKNVMLISNVTVLDPLHVRISFTHSIDEPAFILGFPILPKHLYNRMGSMGLQRNSDYSRDPSGGGSGKFVFLSAMFNGPVKLSQNPNYYDKEPFIERVKLGIQPLYEQIATTLLFGGCHLAVELPPRYLIKFQRTGKHKLLDYNSLSFQYIGHNFENPLLKLKDVRKAITFGTDRKYMLKMIFLNRGTILSGPYTPSDPGYNIKILPLLYDPEGAKEILDNCGFNLIDNDGIRYRGRERLSFNLKVIQDRETTNEVALQFQSNMKEIGIEIHIQHYPRQRWLDITKSGDFDMILGEKEYNAFAEISTIFTSEEIGQRGINYTRFRNATVDSLLKAMYSTTTAAGRVQIKWNLHEVLNDQQPYTFLWSLNKCAVFRNNVRRVTIHPFDFFTYVNEWWIEEDSD